ncbi:hypothetical protein [Nitrosomonas communis]|uniref:hypothetical protein n=1 Tax=Nitrosomonas communis TaxID=44574 RepID=UPI003D289EDC
MELIMGIVFFIGVWWVFSFLRAGMKKKPPNYTIATGETSKSRSETETMEPSVSAYAKYDDGGMENEKDNWERFDFYGAIVYPAKGSYRINYTDQRGLTTERDISIKRVYDSNGKFALDAHCHLRNGHRSFIDDRIKKAVDIETGEVVESLARHAIAQYENSGEGKAWSAIGREADALDILLFVSRADSRMLKAERKIIADYLKRRCNDLVLEDKELDDAIKSLGAIDHRQFKKTIAEMKSSGDIDRLRDITDCAKRIVATQKTIDPLEKAAIEILETAIAV